MDRKRIHPSMTLGEKITIVIALPVIVLMVVLIAYGFFLAYRLAF